MKVRHSCYNFCLVYVRSCVSACMGRDFSGPLLLHLHLCMVFKIIWHSFCLAFEAEARHMYCFSGVGGSSGINFCQVFAFRSFSQKLLGLEP